MKIVKKEIFFTLFFLSLIKASLFAQVGFTRITPLYPTQNQISLNGTWKFKYIPSVSVGMYSLFYSDDFDVSKWDNIKVPGHWELQGFAEPTYKSVNEGTGLYKTNFSLPPTLKNKQIFIRFEGVLYAYEVFINGKEVGNWNSSFNAASFNISNFVRFDRKNTLAVKVSTRSKCYLFDISDCWALSGIFRDVVLFSTTDMIIDDYTVQTFLNDDQSAIAKLTIKLRNLKNLPIENCSLKAVLRSPEGKIIYEKFIETKLAENYIKMPVAEPEFWSAETPALYSLELSLIVNGQEQQKINQKVGVREISIDHTVFKLNGKAIKLRGVDYHDLVPITGRTLSRQQILNDLLLMKKANINFLRTSHYPPDRRRLDLCDSLGIYVVCEVPISFGSGNLKDSTFQNILLQRANATLLRDKNHPSIILWSIGNENPLTPICEVTGKFVKQADPTRPICYPQIGTYFNENKAIIPDFVDVYTPHYENAEWVKNFAKETNRPVILTEYAHGLGLSFGNLADIWQQMFRNKSFTGGAVWDFQDQGILQKADKPVDTSKLTYDVWIDSLNYYKTTLDGADGMVYADRTPQVDYWQLRKVYAPVQIIESELPVTWGKNELKFSVYNQYDFTNLNTLSGEWKLYRNQNIYLQGTIAINCEPHDTITCSLPVELTENRENSVFLLQFEFREAGKNKIYEHTIKLSTPAQFEKIKESIRKDLTSGLWEVDKKENTTSIQTKDFQIRIDKKNLKINLTTQKKKAPIICSGIYARTGRALKMADVTVRDKIDPDKGDCFWEPYLLKTNQVNSFIENAIEKEYRISAKETFIRGEKYLNQKIEGEIQYSIESTGKLKINYCLSPKNANGVFPEAGVSFILPTSISYFHWLGDGPFASYPDKFQLDNFGFHALHKNDINFNGNRSNVEIAVFTDKLGNGIAVVANKANISVELKENQIVVSHNSLVSGLGNKKTIPSQINWAKDVSEIKGEFEIIPLQAGCWPATLKELFGYPMSFPKPFKPFYYSYDTSH